MRPATEETPPMNFCPYGADLVSIFETSEMYVKRRDQYRPKFEYDMFLRQSIHDIGEDSVRSAIANEVQSRTNAMR